VSVTLARLDAGVLEIPFRERFTHSLASRAAMASVWCRIEDESGRVGWGEGCPRSYVTAEALAPTLARLRELAPGLRGRSMASLDELTATLDDASLDDVPALRCALEMALLDLYGRSLARSVADLLGASTQRVRYSAVISAEQPSKVAALARRGAALGFADYKLKVGVSLEGNLARLMVLREIIGPAPSVRVDANAAWSLVEAATQIEALHRHGVALFEQPLAVDAGVAGHRALRAKIPAAADLMVDESLVSRADLDRCLDARVVDRLLLKISKQGGPLRTLEFARRAAEAGVPCHLGSHVGESSLLSAAGRVVAGAQSFATVEGSFGLLLLTADVVADPLVFGPGGWAPVRYASGPGWGLDVALPELV
jgi:muconate cycloisomerase